MNTFELHLHHANIEEPAMVMGFISTALHAQLRRLAAKHGCSESRLVSEFVKQALETSSLIDHEQQ